MTEKEENINERLETTLTLKKANGVTISVSTVCGSWNFTQKFLSDFENTFLNDNNERSKHKSQTEP